MTVIAAEWPIDPLWLLALALLLAAAVLGATRRGPDTPPRPTRTLDPSATRELARVVTESLAHGHKIEAIRDVREALGIGLKDAKGIVDRVEAGESVDDVLRKVMAGAAGPARPAPDVEQAARDALSRDDKIGAIRVVREHTGMGLAEAKAYVEAL